MVFIVSWLGNSSQPHVSYWLWGKRNNPAIACARTKRVLRWTHLGCPKPVILLQKEPETQ